MKTLSLICLLVLVGLVSIVKAEDRAAEIQLPAFAPAKAFVRVVPEVRLVEVDTAAAPILKQVASAPAPMKSGSCYAIGRHGGCWSE